MQNIILTLLILVAVSAAAQAQVYKRVGPDGKVYFSDQPAPGATEIKVNPVPTVKLPPVPEQPPAARQEDAAGPTYTELSIVSPTSDQAVRANDGNITVSLSLQPALKTGHAVVLNIDGEDGEQIKSGGSLTVALSNLSRGRHTLQAAVVDASGEVLIQSGPVSFNVLRVAVGGG
jgi:hypothetical protein